MNPRKFLLVLAVLFSFSSMIAHSEDQVVFSAKVVRIEATMPIKITCGVVLVTRLAEYEVKTVYRGRMGLGRVVVTHLACNGNELDDLNPGDEVFVIARKRKRPEKQAWRTYALRDANVSEVVVQLEAIEVARKIYPTPAAVQH